MLLLAALTLGLLTLRGAQAAPAPDAHTIHIARDWSATTGVKWDIALPTEAAGHLQDQAWLVVDGHSEGLVGGDIPPADVNKPLSLYANISDNLDGAIKDILRAQGFPVKEGVTVYRITYGVDRPDEGTLPQTLRFRHAANNLMFNNAFLPATVDCRIGDRVTIFDAVMLDSDMKPAQIFNSESLKHKFPPGLPTDLVHHVQIQVQFLSTTPDGKIIPSPAGKT